MPARNSPDDASSTMWHQSSTRRSPNPPLGAAALSGSPAQKPPPHQRHPAAFPGGLLRLEIHALSRTSFYIVASSSSPSAGATYDRFPLARHGVDPRKVRDVQNCAITRVPPMRSA